MRKCDCGCEFTPFIGGMCDCSTVEQSPTKEVVGANRHKWADVLIAFAEGKPVQVRQIEPKDMNWIDTSFISGVDNQWLEWRIKPTPKPDFVVYGAFVEKSPFTFVVKEVGIAQRKATSNQEYPIDNLKFTIDGDTHQLKAVEIVK